jgi:hypothetical protein
VNKILIWSVMILVLALGGPALAQPGTGGGMSLRLYNPQTVTTVKGAVEKLEELPSMGRGGGRGMIYRGALLKTDKGSLMVHLGPAWYLDQQKFALQAGDTLEVTGSQVTLNHQPAIIARDVKVAGKTLKLRNDQGIPVWRRPGRGGGMGPGGGQGRGSGGR